MNVRMTNNLRYIHRQKTPNSQLANKYTELPRSVA